MNKDLNLFDQFGQPWVLPQEVAADCRCSNDTLRRAIRDKRIKAIRFGKQWRIPLEEAKRIRREGL